MKQVPQKPILVIIPGWGGSTHTWQAFIEKASAHWRVYCFDLPCFGNEPCPSSVWGVEEYSDWVYEKIKRIPNPLATRIVLMGHSFGGAIAAYIVGTKKDHPISTVLFVNAAIVRPKHTVKRFVYAGIAKIGSIILHPFPTYIVQKAKAILYRFAGAHDYAKTTGIQRAIFQKVTRQDLQSLLAHIQIPSMLIWGEKDTQTPIKHATIIAKQLKQVRVHTISNGTHGLHHEPWLQELLDIVNTTI